MYNVILFDQDYSTKIIYIKPEYRDIDWTAVFTSLIKERCRLIEEIKTELSNERVSPLIINLLNDTTSHLHWAYHKTFIEYALFVYREELELLDSIFVGQYHTKKDEP